MRWSAWPRPNEPRSTSCTWQRRKKKGLGNEIVLDRTRLIQVDLPEQLLAIEFERSEVVLAVRIVVAGERIERNHRCDRACDEFRTVRIDAGRHVELSERTIERARAERVVERGDAGGGVAHDLPPRFGLIERSGSGGRPNNASVGFTR